MNGISVLIKVAQESGPSPDTKNAKHLDFVFSSFQNLEKEYFVAYKLLCLRYFVISAQMKAPSKRSAG